MMAKKFRVGIVGLMPDISWAARAHVPALRSLSDRYEIVGVANTSLPSAERAAAAYGIPQPFANIDAMAASSDIDLISVTVRVPYHLDLVRRAAAGGKHIYCEWPLGNGLTEAEEMLAIIQAAGVRGFVGTQARLAPQMRHLRRLLDEGYVGRVLSVTVSAHGRSWGATHPDAKNRGYLLDNANGATMLTIPLGHTLAALRDVFGDFKELSSIVTNRRQVTRLPETNEEVSFDAPDQVLIAGRIGDGAPISLHYRGGFPRGNDGLTIEVNGTEGDLRLLGLHGGAQQVPLRIEGGRGDEREFQPLATPDDLLGTGWPDNVNPANVARVYDRIARDLTVGGHSAPSFADGVSLHRLIDTIEKASASGARLSVDAPNRPLPAI